MFLPYFCTPQEKRVFELVAQLAEYSEFYRKDPGKI